MSDAVPCQRLWSSFVREAKHILLLQVGGLPLPELNHLELQFLLLNDFRLAIPMDELDAYGTTLVEFYAREVTGQHEGGSSRSNRHGAATAAAAG